MGTRKTEGPVTASEVRERTAAAHREMLAAALPDIMAAHGGVPEAQQGIPWTSKQHVAHALDHLKTAAGLTSDPALQGELNRSHDRLRRRLDLTHGD